MDNTRILTPEEIERISAKEHSKEVRAGKQPSWVTPPFAKQLLAAMDKGEREVILGGRKFLINHVNPDKIWVYAAEGTVPCGWYERSKLKSYAQTEQH